MSERLPHRRCLDRRQRLLQIRDQVADVFDAD